MSKILFIVEGEVTEHQIIENLNRVILKEIKEKEIVSYKTNIYELYTRVSSGKDLNIVEILNEKENLDLYPDEYISVYLFFDYDGHDTVANDNKIADMIKYFDNETENGKLYINYPMIEGIKHIETENGDEFKNIVYKISQGSNYKNFVNEKGYSRYRDITSYSFEIWKKIIESHLKKLNYITNNSYTLQNQKDMKKNTQTKLFGAQKEKYIDVDREVGVISSIPIFVAEYVNKKFYEQLLK